MLTQEQAVEIRVLKRQGLSIRATARETGLSRVTVRCCELEDVSRFHRPLREPVRARLSRHERGSAQGRLGSEFAKQTLRPLSLGSTSSCLRATARATARGQTWSTMVV